MTSPNIFHEDCLHSHNVLNLWRLKIYWQVETQNIFFSDSVSIQTTSTVYQDHAVSLHYIISNGLHVWSVAHWANIHKQQAQSFTVFVCMLTQTHFTWICLYWSSLLYSDATKNILSVQFHFHNIICWYIWTFEKPAINYFRFTTRYVNTDIVMFLSNHNSSSPQPKLESCEFVLQSWESSTDTPLSLSSLLACICVLLCTVFTPNIYPGDGWAGLQIPSNFGRGHVYMSSSMSGLDTNCLMRLYVTWTH